MKAYKNPEFLSSREARTLRILAEYIEPEKKFNDMNIMHTVVFFGSSRIDEKKNKNLIPSIAIGGPHYCPNFNKIQLKSEYAISHVIPEYALPLTETMLKQAEQKTKEQIKIALLDWKGIGNSEQRNQTIDLLNKFGLKYKRTSSIEK